VQLTCIKSCCKAVIKLLIRFLQISISNFSPKIDKKINIKGMHNVYVIEMVQL